MLRPEACHEGESRPNAPEGRRGDLYPTELRARLQNAFQLFSSDACFKEPFPAPPELEL